jgi:hypothetical protein
LHYCKGVKVFWLGAAVIGLAIIGAVCLKSLAGPLNADFTMFWNLKELAYPPPYLLLIKPLTLMPYGAAFILWVTVTGALYVWASRQAKLQALANPAAAFNGMIGQNGFLTGAIMFAGLHELASKPWRGGAILGLLIIKPHLAFALPIAVIAARAWQAIPAALGTVALLLGISYLVFGPAAFAQFFELGAKYGEFVREGAWNWNELASIYALGRWLGADMVLAGSLHAIVAVIAGILVWLAWREDWDGKIPLTCAASLLISPYLFTYDAVLLTLALGWLRGPKALVVWALVAIPLVRVFVHEDWPNTIPLAALFAVFSIVFEKQAQSLLNRTRDQTEDDRAREAG